MSEVACFPLNVFLLHKMLCMECITKYNAENDFFETCYDCGRRVYSDEKHVDKYGHVRCKRCESLLKIEDYNTIYSEDDE